MKITVKSTQDYWIVEKRGDKSNTVRELDGNDEIEVMNTTCGASFKRKITDISVHNGRIIISWKHDDKPDMVAQGIGPGGLV